jgi:hypothetical protein
LTDDDWQQWRNTFEDSELEVYEHWHKVIESPQIATAEAKARQTRDRYTLKSKQYQSQLNTAWFNLLEGLDGYDSPDLKHRVMRVFLEQLNNAISPLLRKNARQWIAETTTVLVADEVIPDDSNAQDSDDEAYVADSGSEGSFDSEVGRQIKQHDAPYDDQDYSDYDDQLLSTLDEPITTGVDDDDGLTDADADGETDDDDEPAMPKKAVPHQLPPQGLGAIIASMHNADDYDGESDEDAETFSQFYS